MARHCMRPGCDRPVAASLTYDTEAVSVWLDRPEDGGEMAQQVCAVHAANLTVPLGWTVTDRRLAAVPSAAPRPPDTAPPAESPPAESPPVESPPVESPPVESPPVEDPADDAGAAAAEAPPAEDPEPPQRKPQGLLDRAFEWTGPQHSVLTTGSPAGPDDGDRRDP